MGKMIVAAEFDPKLAARLKRFAQAAGTFKARVLRMAVEEFIERHLRENAGVREKFERYTREDEAIAARRAEPARHLWVVK